MTFYIYIILSFAIYTSLQVKTAFVKGKYRRKEGETFMKIEEATK